MSINIVPLLPMHVESIAALEQNYFSMPWSRQMIADELDNEFALYYVAENEQGEVVGYSGMHTIIDEAYITNVAVDEKYRRQGIASRLIEKIIEISNESKFLRITLEVRRSNTGAIALYERHGFLVAGLRKGYYSAPAEDGYVMLLELSQKPKEYIFE